MKRVTWVGVGIILLGMGMSRNRVDEVRAEALTGSMILRVKKQAPLTEAAKVADVTSKSKGYEVELYRFVVEEVLRDDGSSMSKRWKFTEPPASGIRKPKGERVAKGDLIHLLDCTDLDHRIELDEHRAAGVRKSYIITTLSEPADLTKADSFVLVVGHYYSDVGIYCGALDLGLVDSSKAKAVLKEGK